MTLFSSILVTCIIFLPTLSFADICHTVFQPAILLSNATATAFYQQQAITKPGKSSVKISLTSFEEPIEGHFPGNPIIPGAMTQLLFTQAAKDKIQQMLPIENLQIKSIMQLSFSRPLRPEDHVTIETQIDRIQQFDDSANLFEGTIISLAHVNGVVAAKSKFIVATAKSDAEAYFSEAEQPVKKYKTDIRQLLPQKGKVLFTDGIDSSTPVEKDLTPQNITPLKGRFAQTFFKFPTDHPFLQYNSHTNTVELPKELAIEMMSQSAIANLTEVLPNYKFDVLLKNVRNAHFYKPIKANQLYKIQSLIMDVTPLRKIGNTTHSSIFKASITQNGELIAEAIIKGVVVVNANSEQI